MRRKYWSGSYRICRACSTGPVVNLEYICVDFFGRSRKFVDYDLICEWSPSDSIHKRDISEWVSPVVLIKL